MVSKVQPLPEEIQSLIDAENAIISQCDGEIASLQSAINTWATRKSAALSKIDAIKQKYATPNLTVWPAQVDAIV